VTRRLIQQGLAVTLDLLGESVSSPTMAEAAARSAADILEAIAGAGLDANLSCKLTQLGLDIDPGLALANAALIQDVATRTQNFFRVDVESSAVTDTTLDIFRKLYARQQNVGIVLQSYLYRTPKDLEPLSQTGVNVRFVKGAYLEPRPWPSRPSRRTTRHTCASSSSTWAPAATPQLPPTTYGIRTDRQLALARAGYRTRIYVPFGHDWYPYFVRRLAERPANVWFVAKNLLRG
jgi:proline dehydrogenase